MTTILKHENIGEIHGVLGDDVVQFLGVKYATLKDRFAESQLMDYDAENSVVDATRMGPMVASPLQGCGMEWGLIQHSLPEPKLSISELDGLNVNITVPSLGNEFLDQDKKLPVVVFIHGGGYAIGSNSWPQYSLGRMVKLSAAMGLPIIGVGINYRLGLPGFLTSKELRDAGYTTNNGLRDQINAFRWIKKNIRGFGGDSDNVTLIGESAGSEPLFESFISMSGSSLALKALSLPVCEFAYASVVKILGLENLSSENRVKKLLEMPIADLEKIPLTTPLMPVMDNSIILGAATFSQISNKLDEPILPMPGRHWCKNLMVGDCQFDASIFSSMLAHRKASIAKSFCQSILRTLSHRPPGTVEKLLCAYHITPSQPDTLALRSILNFATDIGFLAPAKSLAQGWPGKAYLYHFNEQNPWDGEWKGDATHVLDVAFLFQNYNEFLPPPQREASERFAGDVVRFANGEAPWAAFEAAGEGAMVYGPSREECCASFVPYTGGMAGQSCGRQSTIFELAEVISLDELGACWGDFLAGK